MKNVLMVVWGLVLPLFVLAQSSENTLLLSSYLRYENEEVLQIGYLDKDVLYQVSRSERGVIHFLPGIRKERGKGWYHEFSISDLEVSERDEKVIRNPATSSFIEPVEGANVNLYALGILVETGKTTPNWWGGFFRPAVGLGALPKFRHISWTPNTSQNFPIRETTLGLGLLLVPRLHFRLSERLEINGALPLRIGELDFIFSKVQNPALPLPQQNYNTFQLEMDLGVEFARLGAAIRL